MQRMFTKTVRCLLTFGCSVHAGINYFRVRHQRGHVTTQVKFEAIPLVYLSIYLFIEGVTLNFLCECK